MTDVTQVVPIHPTCCPASQHALPDNLNPAQAEVQAAIADADHVHIDETRRHHRFRTPWLWVAIGTVATLFLSQAGRGKQQVQA